MGAIPPNTKTILDVGCNKGDFTNFLAATGRYRLIGVDLSHDVLRHVDVPAVCADASRLPFRNGSFDLVIATELIEHLDEESLAKILIEISRLARSHILITVPYKQDLDVGLVRCRCGYIFHRNYHRQTFSEERLRTLLPGMRLVTLQPIGIRSQPRRVVTHLRHLGGRYDGGDNYTICPKCGNRSFSVGGSNAVTIAAGLLNRIFTRIWPRKDARWMLALYAKGP